MEKLYYKDGKVGINVYKIREDFPNTSLSSELTEELIISLGYIPVETQIRPEETETHYPVKYDRVEGDKYIRGWRMDPKPPEVIARQNERALEELERAEIKADTLVQQFISKTPAQINAYINSQVTDLASAKDMLKIFGKILLIVARREYK
jgi:hypothetical protein